MSTEFDVDKSLKEFSDELQNEGTSIKDIGTTLRDQQDTLKEKSWNAVAKKEELTTFVEIYTVVLTIVATELKTKQIAYEPPKNYMKALVMKVSKRLPQENGNPLLTKWDFMNNLHNIFHEIHEDINPISITQQKESLTPKPNDIEVKVSTHLQTSTDTKTTAYVCKTWQVGTKCKVLDFWRDGVNYSGKECLVQEVYNTDLNRYLVKFEDLTETYIPADKLECTSMGSNTGEIELTPFEQCLNEGPQNTTTESTDNSGGISINVDFSVIKEAAADCVSGCGSFAANHSQMICIFIIFIVMVVISSTIIHGGRMKVKDGNEYKTSSSEEQCLILSYERDKCEFECGTNGCDNYKTKYNGNVYDCDADSGEDDCKGYDYLYTATASNKCGSIELYSNNFDVLESCNGDDPLEIGVEVDCYVLQCSEREFTVHHYSNFASAGTAEIVGGSIFLGVVICCCCCWIAHFFVNS